MAAAFGGEYLFKLAGQMRVVFIVGVGTGLLILFFVGVGLAVDEEE